MKTILYPEKSNPWIRQKARCLLYGRYRPLIYPILAMILLIFLSDYITGVFTAGAIGLRSILIDFIFSVFISILEAGLYRLYLKFIRSETTDGIRTKELFHYFFDEPDQVVITSVILLVLRLILAMPALYVLTALSRPGNTLPFWKSPLFWGVLLFCIAAALLIHCMLLPIWFLMADHPEMKVTERFRESIRLISGYRWQSARLFLSFVGYIDLSLFSFGIGFLWTLPFMGISCALFYSQLITEDLIKEKPPEIKPGELIGQIMNDSSDSPHEDSEGEEADADYDHSGNE